MEDFKNLIGPSFFEQNEALFLAKRVHSAGSNGIERHTFTETLRRAYEDVMELETLYRRLPGTFIHDQLAMDIFIQYLEQATENGMGLEEENLD